MGKSQTGRDNFVKTSEITVGPGQYEEINEFGTEVKSFRIGERREEKVVETLGPGAYSPDRADAITRVKTQNINMGSSPSRASLTRKTGAVDVGPG